MADDERVVGEEEGPLTRSVVGVDVAIDGMSHHVADHRIDPGVELGVDPFHQLSL